MGKAYKAPMAIYQRRFTVTDHAILRLRERLDDKQKITYPGDITLMNALDEAVFDAIQQKNYEHITDDSVPSMIVNLENSEFSGMWALVKPEKNPGPGKPEKYISTCLTSEQVAKNKANADWRWGHKTSVASKINSLADKMKPLLEAAMKDPLPTKTETAPVAVPAQPRTHFTAPNNQAFQEAKDLRLISWTLDGDTHNEVMTSEAAKKFISDFVLIEGGDPADVVVFKLDWVKVEKKVKVEVDI